MKPVHTFKLGKKQSVALYEDHFEYATRQYRYSPRAFDRVVSGVEEKQAKASQYDLALLASLCLNRPEDTIRRIRGMLRFEKLFVFVSYVLAVMPLLLPGLLNIGVKSSAMMVAVLIPLVSNTVPALVAAWSNMTKKKIFRSGLG